MSVSRRKVSQLCKIDIDELHEKLSRVARAVGIVLFFGMMLMSTLNRV